MILSVSAMLKQVFKDSAEVPTSHFKLVCKTPWASNLGCMRAHVMKALETEQRFLEMHFMRWDLIDGDGL